MEEFNFSDRAYIVKSIGNAITGKSELKPDHMGPVPEFNAGPSEDASGATVADDGAQSNGSNAQMEGELKLSDAIKYYGISMTKYKLWVAEVHLVDKFIAASGAPRERKFHRYHPYINMTIGAVALAFAIYLSTEIHSSLVFLVAILAVAVFLYGTGTQGRGSATGSTNGWAYDVSVAGGAGVLALLIGFGFVVYGEEIKRSFQGQYEWVRLVIEPEPKYSEPFEPEHYLAFFEASGVQYPMHREGNTFVTHVRRPLGSKVDDMNMIAVIGFQRLEDQRSLGSRLVNYKDFRCSLSLAPSDRKDAADRAQADASVRADETSARSLSKPPVYDCNQQFRRVEDHLTGLRSYWAVMAFDMQAKERREETDGDFDDSNTIVPDHNHLSAVRALEGVKM